MKYLITAVVVLVLSGSSFGQKVQWLSFEEALELQKEVKKKIFVDVYTDWCGWCKRMDKATFQQPHIADYLNENFYPVKFNAEYKDDIQYRDKVYKFIKSGRRGYHALAAAITKGRLSYPTIVFIDEDLNVLQPIPGFQDPKTFEVIMTFFAGDHFKDTPWQKYMSEYEHIDLEDEEHDAKPVNKQP
ncbi:MAG: DUF255 domain-containing protein [Saprospiraceae bacterium]|nr:DUF255 domain-containing protein [Saprospiraceae bacterium]